MGRQFLAVAGALNDDLVAGVGQAVQRAVAQDGIISIRILVIPLMTSLLPLSVPPFCLPVVSFSGAALAILQGALSTILRGCGRLPPL